MGPKADPVEDFIRVLSDKRVQDLIGNIIENRMKDYLTEIENLKRENQEQQYQITHLNKELSETLKKVDALDSYNRRDNLVITGLPLAGYAEAASASINERREQAEHANATKQAVLALCQELQVPITNSDISIAHRLKKKQRADGPPAVIVRFTNRKARSLLLAARSKLKKRKGPPGTKPIFINEDLTKTTAELFFKARQLVKAETIYSAWTSNGTVFINQTSSQTCHPTCVLSENDLPA